MDIKLVENIYFIGIGGIGMSALARFFNQVGKNIAGYDRTPTPLTKSLQDEGMAIHFEDNVEKVPNAFKEASKTLVIYTPAIPHSHKEMGFFKDNGFHLLKRSQALGLITGDRSGIAIAGTHGKTSISTNLAHLLSQTAERCNAFLGGISKNFNNNFLHSFQSNLMVVEADEFDRSFLQLYPEFALVSSMDADHLDIYGTHSELVKSFNQFIGQIKDGGKLVFNQKVAKHIQVPNNVKAYSYSLNGDTDFHALNLRIEEGKYKFDLATPRNTISGICLQLPGKINVENSIGAIAIAWLVGVDETSIKRGMETYKGVLRRFDYQANTPGLVYIDDYAHHPEELSATISSVKEIYPNRKITGIFQPHLYSRTRDFAEGFAKSLDLLDEIVLLPIYPAREEPLPGITSETIFELMGNQNKTMCSKEELPELLGNKQLEVLLTLGAGDIDQLVQPIKSLLKQKMETSS